MIPECLFGLDDCFKIESVGWLDSANLVLQSRPFSDDSRWLITCAQVSSWCIQDRISEGFSSTADDPVLWQSQFAIYTTFFKGQTANPHRAVCDLLSALPETRSARSVLGPAPNHSQIHLGDHDSDATVISSALRFGNGSYTVAERLNAARMN